MVSMLPHLVLLFSDFVAFGLSVLRVLLLFVADLQFDRSTSAYEVDGK